MVTISLCMIVKNEEKTIARCLASVAHLVDEIIIVDTGSTDKTKEVCRQFTDCLFDFAWVDDFSAARNYAFAQASHDFIFWLDADDVLSEDDQQKFQELKTQLTLDVDAVSMEYQLSFDAEGKPLQVLRRHRLVRRTSSFRWIGAVHEYLEVAGHIHHSDVAVQHKKEVHDPQRNIRIYEKMLDQGTPFSPRDLYYYANELKDHGRYEQAIEYYEKFFATGEGWIEDLVNACNKLSECYRQTNNQDLALMAALRSLQYDHPRAEACCRIGHIYFGKADYHTAIFWYSAAIASVNVKPDQVPMFNNAAYSTWVPHLQLCVCYDRLGSHFLAYMHNEHAARYIPNDERVTRNRAYLEPLAQQDKEALQAKLATQFPETIQADAVPAAAGVAQSKKRKRRRRRR